jgi:uroporphyrinogen decarboxylase
MDPAILRAGQSAIIAEATAIIDAAGTSPGHVFNLGHGITPDIDPENVATLIDTVHSYSAKILAND